MKRPENHHIVETGRRERIAAARVKYLLDLSQEELDTRSREHDPDIAVTLNAVAVSIDDPTERAKSLRLMQVGLLLTDEVQAVEEVEKLVKL